MPNTYADTARKSAGGNWRKPRMKMYDYNQEFGGNYYQPMIHYIYEKEAEGPFHERKQVYLPDRAEVVSDRYTNMRYADRSPVDLDLDAFLTKAYKKQIRDVNSSTAYARAELLRDSKLNTLLLPKPPCEELLNHYVRELQLCADRRPGDYYRYRGGQVYPHYPHYPDCYYYPTHPYHPSLLY